MDDIARSFGRTMDETAGKTATEQLPPDAVLAQLSTWSGVSVKDIPREAIDPLS